VKVFPPWLASPLRPEAKNLQKSGLSSGAGFFSRFSFQFATCFANRIGWFRSSIVWMVWKLESHSIYESRVALLRFNRIRGPISRINLFSRGRFHPGERQAGP
jgi:hypothetical protein